MGDEISLSDLDDAALFRRLDNLYATWPSDGWVGAADVIAVHAEKARMVEKEFARRHGADNAYCPTHPYYRDQCCCRSKVKS